MYESMGWIMTCFSMLMEDSVWSDLTFTYLLLPPITGNERVVYLDFRH